MVQPVLQRALDLRNKQTATRRLKQSNVDVLWRGRITLWYETKGSRCDDGLLLEMTLSLPRARVRKRLRGDVDKDIFELSDAQACLASVGSRIFRVANCKVRSDMAFLRYFRSRSNKILLSYRRNDSAAITGRIFDRLCQNFGKKSVFIDIDNIPYGVDFRKHIESQIMSCTVFIPVIGPAWCGQSEITGLPRILQTQDPVRIELSTAFRLGQTCIPLLVNGAKMPSLTDLPEELHALPFIHAIEIDQGRDFNHHVARLIEAIRAGTEIDSRSIAWTSIVALVVISIAGFGAILARHGWPELAFFAPGRPTAKAKDPAFCKTLQGSTEITNGVQAKGIEASAVGSPVPLLPGYSSCFTQVIGETAYVCLGNNVDEDKRAAALDANVADVRACLDGHWNGPENRGGSYIFKNTDSGLRALLFADPTTSSLFRSTLWVFRHNATMWDEETPEISPGMCPDLLKIVDSARVDFANLKGESDNAGAWAAKLKIRGFNFCDVNNLPSGGFYYSCRLESFGSGFDARAAMAALAAKSLKCLPAKWEGTKALNYKGLPKWKFNNPDDQTNLEIRMVQNHSNHSWRLLYDVNTK